MITVREQLPLLRLNCEEIVHCEESWLHQIIQDAARRCGQGDAWFIEDIAKGVVLYLKDKFEQSSIAIDDLFLKIERTLRAVGCADIAGKLEPSMPPVRLSLHSIAEDAGDGYELMFFELLGRRIEQIRRQGHKSCIVWIFAVQFAK